MDDFVPRVGLPVGGAVATRGSPSPTLPREKTKDNQTPGDSSPAVELDLSNPGALGAALGEAAEAAKVGEDLKRGAAAAKATAEFLQQSMEEIKNSLRTLGLLPEEAEGIGFAVGRRLKEIVEGAYTPPIGVLDSRQVTFTVDFVEVNLSLKDREVSLSLTNLKVDTSQTLSLIFGSGGGTVAEEGIKDRLIDVAV